MFIFFFYNQHLLKDKADLLDPNERLNPDEFEDYEYAETIPLEPHEYYKVHKIKHPKNILSSY